MARLAGTRVREVALGVRQAVVEQALGAPQATEPAHQKTTRIWSLGAAAATAVSTAAEERPAVHAAGCLLRLGGGFGRRRGGPGARRGTCRGCWGRSLGQRNGKCCWRPQGCTPQRTALGVAHDAGGQGERHGRPRTPVILVATAATPACAPCRGQDLRGVWNPSERYKWRVALWDEGIWESGYGGLLSPHTPPLPPHHNPHKTQEPQDPVIRIFRLQILFGPGFKCSKPEPAPFPKSLSPLVFPGADKGIPHSLKDPVA